MKITVEVNIPEIDCSTCVFKNSLNYLYPHCVLSDTRIKPTDKGYVGKVDKCLKSIKKRASK
jgi:hypothetical protein